MDLGLTGKTAFITGGSKGIGKNTAAIMAEEGANVVLFARGQADLADAVDWIKARTGREVLAIAGDVTSDEAVENAIKQTVQVYGGLDIVINNAGSALGKPFAQTTIADWQYDLDLKLFGAIRVIQAALPYLKVRGGAIVNMVAALAKTPSANSLPSTASRTAGMALTKALSHELAADQIRVNTVGIGLVRSSQIEQLWQRSAPDVSWEEFSARPSHGIPLGRIGDTDEASRVVAFLASPAASYVTGTSVNVDGGKTAVL